MKNKFYYIGLNLFIPGAGQLAAKRYVRGILQILSSLGAFFWFVAALFMPFLKFYQGDIMSEKIPQIHITTLMMPLLAFVLILAWSIIDLMFGMNEKIEKICGEEQK